VDEDGVLFSARRAWLVGQLHPIRSDRGPEEVVRRWFIRRLERAEQAVPYRADAEVHDLSMVMEVMESLESSQVGDAREVFAAINPLIRNLTCFQKRRAIQVQQPWEGYDPLIAFFAWLNRLYYCGFLLRLGLLNGYDFPASGVPSDLSWFLWGTLRGHV
jgi:hypothetical protein